MFGGLVSVYTTKAMLSKTNWYLNSAIALSCFVAAQALQSFVFTRWTVTTQSPQRDLLLYLMPPNRLRALLVGATILGLLLPYLTIALRYVRREPVFSVLGFVFGTGFVGAEISQRSIDFFLVGERWARAFQGASAEAQNALLERFELWNDVTMAWYFPLLLAHLLASCCFLRVTWTDWKRGSWFRLAPCAFLLNALRLLGRLASLFAGQTWLSSLNNAFYFPLVLAVNALLIGWFLMLRRESAALS